MTYFRPSVLLSRRFDLVPGSLTVAGVVADLLAWGYPPGRSAPSLGLFGVAVGLDSGVAAGIGLLVP